MRDVVCALGIAGARVEPRSPRDEGGTPIFDGKTLAGWKHARRRRGLQGHRRHHRRLFAPGQLPTAFSSPRRTTAISSSSSTCARTSGPTNSGVQFRSLSTPEFENGRVHGYQADIDPSDTAVERRHLRRGAARLVLHRRDESAGKALYKFGEWNHYRIEAIGPRMRVWINDGPAADVIDDVHAEGLLRACRCTASTRRKRPGAPPRWKNLARADEEPQAAAADGHLHPQQPA